MELASTLRELSSAQDLERLLAARFPVPSSVGEDRLNLRLGQRLLARFIEAGHPKTTLIEFPTGYGKTLAAVVAAHLLMQAGRVSHMLVLVPSDEQRTRWLDDVGGTFLEVGGEEIGAWDATDAASLRYYALGQAKVFVATIQAARGQAGKMLIDNLVGRGTWLVVVDEAQYYAADAEGSAWSRDLKSVLDKPNVLHWLAMSATPLRRDGRYGLLGSPDLVVSMKVAKDEGAIRPLAVRMEEYVVDMVVDGVLPPERVRTSDIERWVEESGEADLTAWEVKRRVRYHAKYLSRIILNTIALWSEKQSSAGQARQHQILVFAMSVRHAKHLAEAFNKIHPGDDKFADYIGDTADRDAARSTAENERVLKEFKDNELPCLVQVAKAGIGFDNKRCSTLLFLNLLGPTPLLMQFIGRGLRRNEEVPAGEDVCDLVASFDHPGRKMFELLEEAMLGGEERPEKEPREPGGEDGPRLRDIPPFFMMDATFDHARIFRPLDAEVEGAARGMETSDDPKARAIRAAAGYRPDVLRTLVAEYMTTREEEKIRAFSLTAQHDQAKAQMTGAFRILVDNVMKLRSQNRLTVDSSTVGDIHSKIHGEWKRHHGVGHGKMTVDDFRAKHEWVRRINGLVLSGTVPGFLAL
jgi:superfamily II DNA or RNA helicase